MIRTALSDELLRRMREQGLSVRRLATAADLNPSQIQAIASRGGTPRTETAEKIDKVLPGFMKFLKETWLPMKQAAACESYMPAHLEQVAAERPQPSRDAPDPDPAPPNPTAGRVPLVESWALPDMPEEGYEDGDQNADADGCIAEWVPPPPEFPYDELDGAIYATRVEDDGLTLLPVGTVAYVVRSLDPRPGDYVVGVDEDVVARIRRFVRRKDRHLVLLADDKGGTFESTRPLGVVVAWSVLARR